MIAIEGLSVRFGGVVALASLSVTLDRPIVGIIGPNGAGKTTLVNAMSGFVAPRSGSIRAFGTELLSMPPHRRARWGLRRSFQQEQIVDELTVEDNVRVVLDPLPLTRGERERGIDAALDFVGLASVRSERCETLSSLQRRMTELARCVAGEPRLILLDEPGAGFSQSEVEQLRGVIAGIHAFNGAMTLLIDHDMELIAATCQQTIVLDFGSLVLAGETGAVLRDERVRAVYLGVEENA